MLRTLAAMLLPLVALLGGCASPASQQVVASIPADQVQRTDTITILIAMDGFRPDYLDRGLTPNLSALADGGVRGAMQPSFPSVTLANFYTLMTGKLPDHHGIVGNAFENESGVKFGVDWWNADWWNGALPLWASIEAQGGHTAHLFYPTLGVDASGNSPTHRRSHTTELPVVKEPDELFKWLDVPTAQRPSFLTLYFYPIDHKGHEYGPNSPELNAALQEVDAAVGNLISGLRQRGLLARTNLVFVADHGMAEVPPGQLLILDELVSPESIRPISLGAYAMIEPAEGVSVETIANKLVGRHDHAECWRKGDFPARFRFGSNSRIAPILCLADNGWSITTQEKAPEPSTVIRGNHGYDPADPDMAAIFIANGPAFRAGMHLPKFDNANVYFLLAELTGVQPEQGDGSLAPFEQVLRAD